MLKQAVTDNTKAFKCQHLNLPVLADRVKNFSLRGKAIYFKYGFGTMNPFL